MSFKIDSVEGTAAELNIDLSVPTQHEREDTVIPAIKKAITEIVESLGGYLSVSANGNINPVSGETGDVVNIYITSLPNPNPQTTTMPESAPEATSETIPVETAEKAIQAEQPQQETAPVVELTPQPVETPSVIQENAPSTEPASITENPAEKAPEAPAPATEPTPPVTPAV